MHSVSVRIATFLFGVLLSTCAVAQVRQSGNVTARHATCWSTTGVVQDCGTAAVPYATSFGTASSGPSLCAASDVTTAAGYQQICLGATTAGGAVLSTQNYGTAAALPFTLSINGSSVAFPANAGNILTATSPISNGAINCFNGTGGLVAPCSSLGTLLIPGAGLSYVSPNLVFDIASLPADTSPNASLDYIPMRRASDGAMVKINPTTIAATNTSGVGSVGGLSGTVGVASGITTSGSSIVADSTYLRVKLQSDTTYYVSSSGSGDCLTVLTPCAQQTAYDLVVYKIDANSKTVTIQYADGTYTTALNGLGSPAGIKDALHFRLIGNQTTPGNVVIAPTTGTAFSFNQEIGGVPQVYISGFELRSADGSDLAASNGGTIVLFDRIRFGTCVTSQIEAHTGAYVQALDNYSVVGNCGNHVQAQSGSIVVLRNKTITYSNTPTFTINMLAGGGRVYVANMTFTNGNTVVGKRFAAVDVGFISTGQTSRTYIPGTTAGTASTGGMIDSGVDWTQTGTTLTTSGGTGTLADATGTITYRFIEPTSVAFIVDITITTNGGGAGAVVATLPFTSQWLSSLSGRDTSGVSINGQVGVGGATVTINKYDNTYPGGDGKRLVVSGTIQAQ